MLDHEAADCKPIPAFGGSQSKLAWRHDEMQPFCSRGSRNADYFRLPIQRATVSSQFLIHG